MVYNDFLDYSTYKIYDLIILNPPFDNGEKHLLKAISLMEKTGGQIICVLNAERKTGVEIALINIKIPKQQLKSEILLNMVKDDVTVEKEIFFKSPIIYKYIENLISSYNFEMRIGINLDLMETVMKRLLKMII